MKKPDEARVRESIAQTARDLRASEQKQGRRDKGQTATEDYVRRCVVNDERKKP